jgi:hypothetical protein
LKKKKKKKKKNKLNYFIFTSFVVKAYSTREEQWEIEQKFLKLCIGITKRLHNFFLNFVVVLPRKLMLMIGQIAINSQSELTALVER